MSKKQQKRYIRYVHKELDKQLAQARREVRATRAEIRRQERAQAASASDVARRLRKRSKELQRRTAEQKRRRWTATNAAAAIGYTSMFEDGICEVEPGFYSATYEFDDITYQSAREDDQMSIMSVLYDTYNYFPSDTTIQLSICNTPLRASELERREFYNASSQRNEYLRGDAEVMNEILTRKLAQGVSNIRRHRYLTVGVSATDPTEAYRRLSRISTDLSGNFESIKCPLTALDGKKRLEVLQGLLRPGQPFTFDYDKIFLYDRATTKDFICPMAIDFKPDGATSYFKMDGKYCQVLAVRDLENPLDDTCIASLADMQIPLEITWYLKPWDKAAAVNRAKLACSMINTDVVREQKQAVKDGYDYTMLSTEVKYARQDADEVLAKLQGQQQHLFDFTGLIYTYADDFDQLIQQVLQIIDVGQSSGINIEPLEYRQRQGLNSILPLAMNHVEVGRTVLTSVACTLVPFATQELEQEGGNWYYQNRLSNNLVFGNRANLASPVGFISGKTGSGKGFFAKNEIMGTLLSKPNDQVIILDRAGEYRLLVEHAQGTYATFGVGFNSHMNPLGMQGLEHQDFGTQVAFKSDAMIALAAAAAEQTKTVFSEEERSIIQRCVENVFRRWQADLSDDADAGEPILSDYYQELKRQPEQLAKSIALRNERFVQGFTDFFNHPTDIDLDASIIGLNFKEVPDSMLTFSMISFCETIRFIMYRNFERGRRTWLYIEEMESLFKYPSVLNYFRRFANECRKFGMYLTGITQSTESMIRNEDANAIVKNSDFIMLLKQSKEDRDYWANALGLSPAEVSYIDESAKRGWGLLVFGGTRVPIKGEFPTNNHLYDLFSTDPNEWESKRARGLGDREAPTGDEFRKQEGRAAATEVA